MSKLASWTLCASLSSLPLSSFAFAAAPCAKAYQKVFPYDLPLGSDKASVNLHSELRFSYDCTTVLSRASADAAVRFLSIDLDLLQSEFGAQQVQNGASIAFARLAVAGYEVAREEYDLEHVVDTTISPDSDFDFSETKLINVGPLVIPLQYGIEGNAALEVKAGWKNLALEAQANPLTDARVYVQADANAGFAEVVARGDLVLLKDKLQNTLRLSFENDGELFVRVEATSLNSLHALDGAVFVRGRIGAGAQSFERQLFAWPGFDRSDAIAEFSDRFPLRPAL